MPIRVGLIGFGLSGRVFHAPFIDVNPAYELSAVVSRQEPSVKERYPQAQVMPSVDRLFADPNIDLVIIGTPNETHYPLAKAAIQHGKSVVVEKPFTVSVAEADELVTLAEAKGVVLSVYHNRRFDGAFLTLQRLLAAGWLGDIVYYEAHFDRYRPQVQNRWRERDEPGAGVLYDLGSHLIDQALCLFGRPQTVYADLACQRDGAQAVDYMHLVLQYDRLRVVLHSGSLVKQTGPNLVVHGTHGSFVHTGFDPQEDKLKQGLLPLGDAFGKSADNCSLLTVERDGLQFSGQIETLPGNYQRYYDALAAAIRAREPVPVPAAEARDVMSVITLAEQSASVGRALPFMN